MNDLRLAKQLAKQEFMRKCSEDVTGLWNLLWTIRYVINDNDYPVDDISDPSEVRRIAIEIVSELLSEGRVDATFTNCPLSGDYRLEPAEGGPGEIVDRIEREWTAMGKEPTQCDIVEFTLKGRPHPGIQAALLSSSRHAHPLTRKLDLLFEAARGGLTSDELRLLRGFVDVQEYGVALETLCAILKGKVVDESLRQNVKALQRLMGLEGSDSVNGFLDAIGPTQR